MAGKHAETPPCADASMDYESLKKEIFMRMNPRRRKFVERIGYENWDPFQKPNDPLDMRADEAGHTISQLAGAFKRSLPACHDASDEYMKGAMECAAGLIKKDDRYQGIYDFCLWYADFMNTGEDKDERTL